MAAPSTVRPPGSRRVVRRRRATLDAAYDVALAELPPELRPLVIRCVENMLAGQEDDSLEEIFGNDRLTYGAMRDCDESCGMGVDVVRMQDGRRAIAPNMLISDLI